MGLLDHKVVTCLIPGGASMLFYNDHTSLRAWDGAQDSFPPHPHPHVLFLILFITAILPCEVKPLT